MLYVLPVFPLSVGLKEPSVQEDFAGPGAGKNTMVRMIL